jgi:hypothetical protein
VRYILYDTATYKGNQPMRFASGAGARGLKSTVAVPWSHSVQSTMCRPSHTTVSHT